MAVRPTPLTEAAWFQAETDQAGSDEELALRRASTHERLEAREPAAKAALDELSERFGNAVYRVVPPRYDAYCKVLHPIFELTEIEDRDVTWDEWERRDRGATDAKFETGNASRDAALTGLVEGSTLWKQGVEPDELENARRVSWRELADRYGVTWGAEINGYSFHKTFAGSWPRYLAGPEDGEVDRAEREVLVRLLDPFTSGDCFFWFWLMKTGRAKGTYEDELYVGRLDDLTAAIDELDMGSPSAFWPADRSWFAAIDYDLDFTLLGGSRAVIDELLAASDLECIEVKAETRIDYRADAANA